MKIIEINLLPPEYAPPSPYSFRNIAMFALSLLVAILLIPLALRMVNLKNKYNSEYKQLMQNIEMYGKEKQQVNKLKEQETILNQRRDMLLELIGQRFTWSDKLINLYEQIPENLWLSSISSERQEIEVPETTSKREEKDKSPPKKEKPPATKQRGETASQNEETSVQQLIRLHLSGDALKLPQISEFITRLDESPFFEKTKLLSIGQSEREGHAVMLFEITTQLTTQE